MVNRSMTSGDRAPRGDRRDYIRLLGTVPGLSDASASLLGALVDVGHLVRIPERWALLPEGTAPDKAYVLLNGEVDVRRGREQIGHCSPGELLGELGIVHRRLRSATVVAATSVTALHLGRDEFERLYAEHADFRALVGEAMLRKTA